MSDLEGKVRPIVKQLASRQNSVLGREDKACLAAWAHKCFLMYDLYQDSRDRAFIDEDYTSFKRTQKPPVSARLYLGITDSRFAAISLWHQPRLFIPAGSVADPQTVLGTSNMSSSSFAVQGVYFIQQFFRPNINWNALQRRAIGLSSQAAVESTPARPIWPLDNKPIRLPPKMTSASEFGSARLALHSALATLPVAVERVKSLE
ncbi:MULTISPECIES: hypothetical protein [Paenarthrobacter]|nr:hypothetical protein [Paenarthrobacter ureafaciens]